MDDVAVRFLGSLTFWGGLRLGVPTGIAFQRMRSAWNGHRVVKRSVPGLAKARWGFVRKFVVLAAVVTAFILFSLAWIAGIAEPGETADGFPARTPAPARPRLGAHPDPNLALTPLDRRMSAAREIDKARGAGWSVPYGTMCAVRAYGGVTDGD